MTQDAKASPEPSVQDPEPQGKAKGGLARKNALSPARRKEIAQKAAQNRWAATEYPRATHAGNLEIGESSIPCYVLENGERVLSTRGIMKSLGRPWRGRKNPGTEVPVFIEANNLRPFISKELGPVLSSVVFRTPQGMKADGFKAEILPTICDIFLTARDAGVLTDPQKTIARRCEILVRGLSRVGVIALVDEATGYEKDRIAGSLARILEAFIAKELQPWVRTFPADYYEQLFRLRGLPYSSESVKRPLYFGLLTNDIVYKRLAPGVLEELKNVVERDDHGRPKYKYFQKLTQNVGYPKLREHLGSVVTIMKLSSDYLDFKTKLDRIHPPHLGNLSLPFYEPEKDDGQGL